MNGDNKSAINKAASVVGVSGTDPTPPMAKPGSGKTAADTVVSQAKESISKRKRGRPTTADKTKLADAEKLAMVAELEKIFSPEQWKGLVGAPADMALSITGREHWKLSEAERNTMAASVSNAARYFMHTDPKWIVLTLCLFNIGTIYGGRLVLDFQARRKEQDLKPDK